MNHSTHLFDLVIGQDRSDQKADLYLIDPRSGTTRAQSIGTAPEALHDWLYQLRQEYSDARVAICLEQPAASLILFLETYEWLTLYAINPITRGGVGHASAAIHRACAKSVRVELPSLEDTRSRSCYRSRKRPLFVFGLLLVGEQRPPASGDSRTAI